MTLHFDHTGGPKQKEWHSSEKPRQAVTYIVVNIRMAQRKQKQLEGQSAASVAQKARRSKELKTISEMADANLNPADEWRAILPEHIEAIKTRIIGGDTLPNICRGLGINQASFTRHAHENPELLKEYLDWKSFGTHALWDRLFGMIDNTEMNSSDKMFAFKVINAYTGKINREVYGEHVKVDQTVTVQPVSMPGWSFGQVIDVTPTEVDPDDDEFDG